MWNNIPDIRVAWKKYEITIPVVKDFSVDEIFVCDPCKYYGRNAVCDRIEKVYGTTSYQLKKLNFE